MSSSSEVQAQRLDRLETRTRRAQTESKIRSWRAEDLATRNPVANDSAALLGEIVQGLAERVDSMERKVLAATELISDSDRRAKRNRLILTLALAAALSVLGLGYFWGIWS
jgi:hypothetical protein